MVIAGCGRDRTRLLEPFAENGSFAGLSAEHSELFRVLMPHGRHIVSMAISKDWHRNARDGSAPPSHPPWPKHWNQRGPHRTNGHLPTPWSQRWRAV